MTPMLPKLTEIIPGFKPVVERNSEGVDGQVTERKKLENNSDTGVCERLYQLINNILSTTVVPESVRTAVSTELSKIKASSQPPKDTQDLGMVINEKKKGDSEMATNNVGSKEEPIIIQIDDSDDEVISVEKFDISPQNEMFKVNLPATEKSKKSETSQEL